jgi:hypothetical protein
MSSELIPCICGRDERHRADCNVAIAFRYRCPECKSRKREDGTIPHHASHCPFKGVIRP